MTSNGAIQQKVGLVVIIIKSRRDWVSIAALRNHAVFKWRLSVCPSVCLSVCLSHYNSRSGHGVRLNLKCQQSPRPGEGYRRKKMKKCSKLDFWRIFKLLKWTVCVLQAVFFNFFNSQIKIKNFKSQIKQNLTIRPTYDRFCNQLVMTKCKVGV